MTDELASAEELASFKDVPAVLEHVGLKEEGAVWFSFNREMGSIPSLRIFAQLPASVIKDALESLRVDFEKASGGTDLTEARPLTPVESTQVGLAWRVARQVFKLRDIDLSNDNPVPEAKVGISFPPAAVPQREEIPASKRVKCSSVIDQSDETEIRNLSSDEVARFFQNHIDVVGAEPLEECCPTPEQISALYDKVVIRGEEPYADFSVLTPFGRRVQKLLRMRSWLLQQDGSYRPIDVPGPPTFEAWYACFRVYRAVLLMLQYASGKVIVKPASIEAYLEAFRKLASLHPESWHLCALAEDRCRGEHFARIKRELARAHSANVTLPLGVVYDPEAPWDAVFSAAARDDRFWDAEVRRPAIAFLARGSSSSCPVVPSAAHEAMANVAAAANGRVDSGGGKGAQGLGVSRAARQKRKLRAMLDSQGPGTASGVGFPASSSANAQSGEAHPKKWGSLFQTTREGKQICFTFAKGRDCASPCANGRAHVCQFCLQPHKNADCNSKSAGGGKGKSKGKGGRL